MAVSEEDKELQKLTANWINGLAVGSFTAGVATPVVGYFLGILAPEKQGDVVTYGLLFFVASVAIHIAAHITLLGYGEP